MAQTTMTLLLVLLTVLSLATCQTFQYSRGWTNGKRSELSSQVSPADLDNVFKPSALYHCANLHKWRMFLHPSDDEICRVPCEFLDVLRQCLLLLQHDDKVGPTVYKRSAPADSSSISSLSY